MVHSVRIAILKHPLLSDVDDCETSTTASTTPTTTTSITTTYVNTTTITTTTITTITTTTSGGQPPTQYENILVLGGEASGGAMRQKSSCPVKNGENFILI
jgi:hypothetical protein